MLTFFKIKDRIISMEDLFNKEQILSIIYYSKPFSLDAATKNKIA